MNQQAWNLSKTIEELTIEGQDFKELVSGGIELIREEGEDARV